MHYYKLRWRKCQSMRKAKTKKKEETIKHICAGCKQEFDLLLSRYKSHATWGKKDFYCNPKCIVRKVKFTI